MDMSSEFPKGSLVYLSRGSLIVGLGYLISLIGRIYGCIGLRASAEDILSKTGSIRDTASIVYNALLTHLYTPLSMEMVSFILVMIGVTFYLIRFLYTIKTVYPEKYGLPTTIYIIAYPLGYLVYLSGSALLLGLTLSTLRSIAEGTTGREALVASIGYMYTGLVLILTGSIMMIVGIIALAIILLRLKRDLGVGMLAVTAYLLIISIIITPIPSITGQPPIAIIGDLLSLIAYILIPLAITKIKE